MPRIRTIKPEFWSSPSIGDIGYDSRLLYIAMWNWCDDHGRGTANPRELAGFAFPYDENVTSSDVRRMLGEVRRAFGVIFYLVDGRPYFAIPSWHRHQKIDKRSKHRHPAPDDGKSYDPSDAQPVDQQEQKDSTEPAESSPNTRRTSGVGTGEQRNRGTEEPKDTATRSRSTAEPEGFADFWDAYPRKDNKQAARKSFTKAVKQHGADELTNQAHRWAGLWKAAGTEKQFIPHAATWLNGQRWTDEPPTERLRAVSGGHQPFRNPVDPVAAYGGEW